MARNFLPLILCFSLVCACSDDGTKAPVFAFTTLRGSQPPNDPSAVDPALVRAAADAQRTFAADLYRRLAADPTQDGLNLIVSPYSIFSAFNLLFPGAAGHTADALRATFFLSGADDGIFAGQGALDQTVRAHSSKNARLETANSAFVDNGYAVYQTYLDTITSYYGAEIYQADFRLQSELMRAEINRWVEYHTADKIHDLLPPDSVSQDTGLVLVNAVYFNAKWKTAFEDGTAMTFHGATGDQAFTSMRSELGTHLYDTRWTDPAPANPLQIVALPYKDEQFDMLVFLPGDFAAFQTTLDGTTLGSLIDDTYATALSPVVVNMPEFTIEWELKMNDLLTAMGLGPAFCDASPAPDFTRMADNDYEPCISGVFHKAFVEVNKVGTEAAAATGVVQNVNSCNGGDVFAFTADRPFLYAIVDRETRTILFLGHMLNL
ncbi:serpin family protein [Myxococcota bacterium]|nr:serpin family protein [Myxococcota bacterium]